MSREFQQTFESLDLFRDLPPSDLDKFLAQCREEEAEAGELLVREGDAADKFYILLEGQVEIWKDFDTPYADQLAVRGPGACFGEMALIDELPRSATVRATTRSKMVTLAKPHFRHVIEQNPAVALLIMKTVSHLVRLSNDAFQDGLRERNLMLEKAYSDLQRAQADLVRSERLSALGKFASMIIHDLRNPLSIVKGYAEILAVSEPGPERTAELAAKLLAETGRLNRMVGELLDYSRGSIRLNLATVHLDDLFRQLKDEFDEPFAVRDIRLEVSNSVDQPLLLDLDRMRRVFTNLLENAKKALRHGGHVRVAARLGDDGVVVTVEDDGEGMDEATRARLFEPFFSASGSGGTGLGLLVVSNVVEAHQGTIAIASQPGVGTTITLTLPLRQGGLVCGG